MTSDRPTANEQLGGALRLLRERAWLGALAGVVLLSVVFVFLGRWQYSRHEARSIREDRVAANYDAAPAALADVLPGAAADPSAPLPPDLEWRPVRVSGTYLADATVLVRNRPRDGDPGYEVVVPLRLGDGLTLLVNRGWVPAGTTGAAPDDVPPPPAGTVDLLVRLRPAEAATDRTAPRGQVHRINAPQVAEQAGADLGDRVLSAYGVLDSETPALDEAPLLPARPDPGMDINLPYAFQWWAFAVAAYVLLAVGAVREVRRRDAARGSGPDRRGGPGTGAGPPAAAGPRVSAAARTPGPT